MRIDDMMATIVVADYLSDEEKVRWILNEAAHYYGHRVCSTHYEETHEIIRKQPEEK